MNNQQKTFCQEYVKNGMNGTKAYMAAYPDSSEESARRQASRLLTNVDIQKYIEKLQSKNEDKAIMSVQDRMRWLTELVNSKKEKSVSNKLKALEILNKMDGVYTQNVAIKGDMVLNNPLRELSTEQIIEMINNEK
ncbi:MAG: terminase small subunit [Methanosphaera sp.]|nr:terminase small subunit [Methanosphaera sp.]